MKHRTLFLMALAEMFLAMSVDNFLAYAGGLAVMVYVLPHWADTWPDR